MKQSKIIAPAIGLGLSALLAAEQSALTFSAGLSGSSNQADARAIRFTVAKNNEFRANNGLPLLFTNNAAAYRSNYLVLLSAKLSEIHDANIARSVDQDALAAQLGEANEAAIRAAIASNLLSGETPAKILQRLTQ